MDVSTAIFLSIFTPVVIGCIWLILVAMPMYLFTRLFNWILNHILRPVLYAIKSAIPLGIGRLIATFTCFLTVVVSSICIFLFIFLPLWWFVLMCAAGQIK